MNYHKSRGPSVGPRGKVWMVRRLANGDTSVVVHIHEIDDSQKALNLRVGGQVAIVENCDDREPTGAET